MARKSTSFVLAALLTTIGLGLTSPAMADDDDDDDDDDRREHRHDGWNKPQRPMTAQWPVFYACAKDNKVIPGTIQVTEKPNCRGGSKLVGWGQGRDVKVFGGTVASDGSIVAGKGFTVQRVAVGTYQITFARGMATKDATLSVTPYGVLYGYVNPVVTGYLDMGGGKLLYEIRMSTTTPVQNLADNPFMFIVVKPATTP
jgi:hypothetical protein